MAVWTRSPLLCGLLLLAATACRDRPGPAAVAPRARSSEPALARVNGAPVLLSDLRAQHRTGRSVEQSLRELVQLELLAAEASRRGLDRHPQVLREERRAMAELFVRRRFRDQLGPAQIPRQLVEKAYQLNRRRYVHPELVEVSHVLVVAGKRSSSADHRKARALADKIRALATARPRSAEEFLALKEETAPQAGGLQMSAESLTTPLRGYTVEPFADAAFALDSPGAVSPVVQTQFGYHVIYLRKRIPASSVSFEQAEPEIRKKILEEARTEVLQGFITELEKKYAVRLQLDNLPAAAATEGRP